MAEHSSAEQSAGDWLVASALMRSPTVQILKALVV